VVTELKLALREAAEEPPGATVDLAGVILTGEQRVHRGRVRRAAVATLSVATAVAVALVFTGGGRRAEPVLPARPDILKVPTTLYPEGARPITPEVLATTRVLWLDPANELDYDRYDGLTTDGLVVRARYTSKGDVSEFGLLDPATGVTDWLPRPPWDLGEPRPVDFSADRLLYLDNRTARADAVLSFDRATRAWARVDVAKPAGTDRLFGMRAVLGPDDLLYLLNPAAPGPGEWWSVPAARGGTPAVVQGLRGMAIAWHGRDLATVDRMGRVVITTGGRARVVATARPRGCDEPAEADFGAPAIGYSGARLVVTYVCRGQSQVVVFRPDGRPQLGVERAGQVAAIGTRWILFSEKRIHASNGAHVGRTMALDVDAERLVAIGAPLHENDAAVVDNLVLWAASGPSDSDKVYDVVYRVARLT
jgi:hypothetical protein